MNPGRYFMPNMAINNIALRNGYRVAGYNGLFNRIITGMRSFNWGKLLNGTSKTLNVVNQAIPIVRQVKPVVGNVKSMIRLAHAFGSETTNSKSKEVTTAIDKMQNMQKKEASNSNYPNFFI